MNIFSPQNYLICFQYKLITNGCLLSILNWAYLGQHIHTIIVSWYASHVQNNVSYAQGIIKDRQFTVHLDPPQLMHFCLRDNRNHITDIIFLLDPLSVGWEPRVVLT